jgi:hypothetical protein
MPESSMFAGRHEDPEDSTRIVYVILWCIQHKRDKVAEEVCFKSADIWKSLKRMMLDLPETCAQNGKVYTFLATLDGLISKQFPELSPYDTKACGCFHWVVVH